MLPSDPEGDDEIVELTATVRALKLRMSSLSKLLDEAVARRQKLEKELAGERERAEATAEELEAAAAASAASLKEATAEVAVLKEQLDETRESLASESGKLAEAEAEVEELTREKEDLAEATEEARAEARKRLKEATDVRFELQATREMLEATELAKTEMESSLKAISAETEKRLEARLKAGVDDAAAALAASARREADETTRKAAALLASATEIEAKARGARQGRQRVLRHRAVARREGDRRRARGARPRAGVGGGDGAAPEEPDGAPDARGCADGGDLCEGEADC